VVGDEVVAAMKRLHEKNPTANLSAGARGEKFELSPDQNRLALEAARTVGADYAGVDLLIGRNGDVIIGEVNTGPVGLKIMEITGVNIGKKVGEFLVHKLKR
jgi:ribosomal protein S6--L-glutamate ligase/gamma-F420-2:alpha-L-glutamate ligase